MARVPLSGKNDDDLSPTPKHLVSDTSNEITKEKDRQIALKELEELAGQYRAVATDNTPSGKIKAAELARKINEFDMTRINGPTKYVDIDVPADHQGFSFWINDKEFAPGTHRVTEGEAQVLLYMIDQNRRAGMKIFQDRGRNINLGNIGDMARAAEIQKED